MGNFDSVTIFYIFSRFYTYQNISLLKEIKPNLTYPQHDTHTTITFSL